MPAVDAKVLGGGDICGGEHLVVMQSPGADPLEEAQDRGVGVGTVGDEKVRVLGGPHVAVGDHAEAADDDVLEPDGVGVGDDAVEVRTRELV